MSYLQILDDLYNKCDDRRVSRGIRLLNQGAVNVIDRNNLVDDVVVVSAEVDSSNKYHKYDTEITLDSNKIINVHCSCADFEKKYDYNDEFICKHCAAVIIKIYNELRNEANKKIEVIKEEKSGEMIFEKLNEVNKFKSKLNLEIYIDNRNNRAVNLEVNLKVGIDKLYIVKSMKDFIISVSQNKELFFGQKFTYNPYEQEFSTVDEELIELLSNVFLANYNPYGTNSIVRGKNIYLSTYSLRTILKILKDKGVYYNDNFYEIVEGDIPININIDDKEEYYDIYVNEEIIPMSKNSDTYIYDGKIYIPSKNQVDNLKVLSDYFVNKKKLKFKKENSQRLFNNILPSFESISNKVNIDTKINNIIKSNLQGEFYIDEKNKKLTIEIKAVYDDLKINIFQELSNSDKILIRDVKKEKELINLLESFNFIRDKNIFIFNGNEEEEYDFIIEECRKLKEAGEVYYSDKLKNRKVYKSPNVTGRITEGKDGYLDFSFNIEDIDNKEYENILKAFKDNKKYYKLKDNSILNLQHKEVKDLLSVVDKLSINNHKNNNLKLSKNKAIVLNEYLSEKEFNYIEGMDVVKEISDKLNNIEKLDLQVPSDLNAKLRDYQVVGYKWFKNLSYLGFGGILADEMGLGKTVQTISFLLSERNKKSLIIAPTSLIYNWKNEFMKFAPNMKVEIVHGNKGEREKTIANSDEYDVILTTYGTLRNDIDLYDNKIFDYCVLDEGQNIKNPLSKISNNVKKVNAKCKFVLSGTPIENNLLELWSIFDFIMPQYLYSSSDYKKRYIDSDNKDDLIKHISPFILRREKKEVINELPQKIEKKYYIEMTKEQKKVYKSYVEDIKGKLEDKSFEKDKITIFSYLTKLRQICLDPSLVMEGYKGKSAKIIEALEIIKDNIEKKNKILLFSQFTSLLQNLSEKLNKENINYMYLDGSTSAKKRLEMVEEFNNSSNCNIFLISLKAGGTGLNLTSANVVIHFDPWWNPAIEDQATDRAHRIGQKNIVNVIKLISEGTIEEKIIKMQDDKKKLIGDIINNEYTSENKLTSLSSEELRELLY